MRATLRRPLSARARHPFAEFDQLWRELDRWAAATRPAPRRARLNSRPTVHHNPEDHTWTLAVPLPGVSADDLDITVDKGVLTVEAKVAEVDDAGFEAVHRERSGPLPKVRWTLPEQADLDRVKASLTDGWLRIEVAEQARPEPRKIAVSTGR